jgi:hypothetical protein
MEGPRRRPDRRPARPLNNPARPPRRDHPGHTMKIETLELIGATLAAVVIAACVAHCL